jgi:hypothetical protein
LLERGGGGGEYARAAQKVAARYADFSPARQSERMVEALAGVVA